MFPSVSVVVPVHNEAGNIHTLISNIDESLSKAGICFEMIFVNDGSDDDTDAELQKVGAAFPRLRVIHHPCNCGQSTAILTGIRCARGNIIATLDGDNQNDPSDIPKMIHLLEKNDSGNLQMIAGIRKKRNDNTWRRLCSKTANTIRKIILKDDAVDTGCGLKVFYREAFLSLPYFSNMHRFLPALIQRQHGHVDYVEVNHNKRLSGNSHYGALGRLWEGIIDILGVLWLQKRCRLPEGVENFGAITLNTISTTLEQKG